MKKGVSFSLADAQAHAARHGYTLEVGGLDPGAENQPGQSTGRTARLPKPVRMTVLEREMGMMLEADKRQGKIVDYIFQGMSLAYGADPETGVQLRYKCDYVVITEIRDSFRELSGPGLIGSEIFDLAQGNPRVTKFAAIRIIECKGFGRHAISAAAKLRFKGAKAAWPMFKFEMHQRCQDGQWRRVL